MAKQGIFTGSSPNDGTGDSLAAGAIKINSNFDEIYSTFGNGTNLISYAINSGIATIAAGLTGSPSIEVNRVVGGMTSSIIPFLWDTYADLPLYINYEGAIVHAHDMGKMYFAHGGWLEIVNKNSDGTVGTGTESYNVGVLTASSLSGDGESITNIRLPLRYGSIPVGLAATINFVGSGLSLENAAGVATVNVSAGATVLDGLTDVSFSGLSTGQVLQYNGTTWSNGTVSVSGTSFAVNDLTDVNAGAPSTGHVLKWSGTEWIAAADQTAAGAGIGLSDLSVTIASAGINSLTYNNVTGVFEFTPADLSSYLTGVTITAGANIDVVEVSEGNFIITSTASGSVGSAGTWAVNASGIHTSKNVGIGTELSSSALWVEGDGRFSGVVTATRFESSSAGTPTIDSPNNVNINAITVAISTDLTVGGDAYVGVDTSSGLVLSSPNGTQYRLIVDNSGNLSTIVIP